MKHIYGITGMTCASCAQKITEAIQAVEGVRTVVVHRETQTAEIEMTTHIALDTLNNAVKTKGAYALHMKEEPVPVQKEKTLATYYPLLLVLGYLVVVTTAYTLGVGNATWREWMRFFMGGFFIVFSFFKLLDLRGFAGSYRSYDVITKAVPAYGYVYPFIELALGLAYISAWNLWFTSAVTLVVMVVSIIGVIQSVMEKRAIKCACLGTVFNLPMTTVTIVEDGVMILMALMMLW